MGYERQKRLLQVFSISKEEAKEIDLLLSKIRKVSGAKAEVMLKRINKLIGGYGVEAIRGSSFRRGYYGDIVALYINKGDTYDTTIIFNTITKMPMIASMGYFVEKNMRKYNIQ